MADRRDDPFEEFKRLLEQLREFQNRTDDGDSPFEDFGPLGGDFDPNDLGGEGGPLGGGDNPFGGEGGPFGGAGNPFGGQEDIAVDLVDRDEEFVVTADLPGYTTEDIDLTFRDGSLKISAHREVSMEEEDGDFITRERWSETVSRTVPVRGDVVVEDIDAEYENGVLTVTMPKADPDDGQQIEIE